MGSASTVRLQFAFWHTSLHVFLLAFLSPRLVLSLRVLAQQESSRRVSSHSEKPAHTFTHLFGTFPLAFQPPEIAQSRFLPGVL